MTDPTPPPPPPPASPPLRRRPRWKALVCGGCAGLFILALIGGSLAIAGFFSTFNLFGDFTEDEVTETIIKGTGDDKIALIPIHGLILTEGVSGEGVTYATTIETMAQRALDDEDVKAVIIDIDSPGGGVAASARIYDALEKLDAEKPVIAFYSGDIAASGGVYVSMAARRIVAYQEVWTGSIGVIMEFPEVSALLEKYGITWNVFRSGALKDIGNFARPVTEEERTLLQGLIDESYQGFVGVIAHGRNLSPDQIKTFADGRIYTATTAQALGMVDEVGDLDRVETLTKELAGLEEATIIKYEQPIGFGALFGSYASKLGQPDALAILQELRRTPGMQIYYLME